MRSKIKLVGIGLLSILTLGFLVKKGADVVSQADNIADKFIFDFGSFRIHKVDFSGIVLAIDGIKLYNQSQFSATIQNLYVNVKYLSGASQAPLLIQDNFLNPISINANSATVLPSILFKLSLSNLIVLYQMYKKTISDRLFINVRFQVLGGYEISLDNEQTLAPQFAILKALFDHPIIKTILGGTSSASTGSQNNNNANTASNNNAAGQSNSNYQGAQGAQGAQTMKVAQGANFGNVENSLFKN